MNAKYIMTVSALLFIGLSNNLYAEGYWELLPETTNGVRSEYIRDSDTQSIFNSVLGTFMNKFKIEVPTNTLHIYYEFVFVEDGKSETSLWKYEYNNQSNASNILEETISFVVKPIRYGDSFYHSTKWIFIINGARFSTESPVVKNPLAKEKNIGWGYDSKGLHIGTPQNYVVLRITRRPGIWVDKDIKLTMPYLFVEPE